MRISDEYLAQQQQLHVDREDYGVASLQFADMVSQTMQRFGLHNLIDYGCGKGRLIKALVAHLPPSYPFNGQLYDPAVPQFAKDPSPGDLLVCIDVLEHVEPECVEDVLDHMQSLAREAVFLSISLVPAAKSLPDGRNAHINLLHPNVWLAKHLLHRWVLMQAHIESNNLIFIGKAPKKPPEAKQ